MRYQFLSSLLVFVAVSSSAVADDPSFRIETWSFSAPSVNGKANVNSAAAGDMVFDSSDSTFYGHTGTAWTALSGGGGGTSVPAGTVLPYVGTTAPTGYLLCDGTSYVRTSYSDLATALGCSGSTCAFGAIDSTHFNVPDLRGRFIRGTDGTAGHDPDAASRTTIASGGASGNNVGSLQADALASHSHTSGANTASSGSPANFFSSYTNNSGASVSVPTTSVGGNETRPKNVYVNFIIKY